MKTCKRCAVSKDVSEFNKEPRVKDGLTATCKPCNKELGAQWRLEHREQYNATQARWRAAHPETALAKGRAWRTSNIEKSRAFTRKWSSNNKDKVKAKRERWARENRARVSLYTQERRAREAGASGTTSPAQLQARIDYYGGCCYICRDPFTAIDHVIPLKLKGTNWPANLRPICKACNSAKGAKPLAAFLRVHAQARL